MNVKNFKEMQSILGKKVRFTATCALFPEMGIKGKLSGISHSNSGELLYSVAMANGKKTVVGSNTSGLSVTLV